MKIVHLVVDDKFIDGAIRDFEAAAPGAHEYLAVCERPPWRYLKSPLVMPIEPAQWAARVAAPDVAAVVLHGLPPHHYPLLRAVPPGPVVAWLGWGYDYYGLLADAFPQGLLMPQTAELVARLAPAASAREPTVLAWARPCAKPTDAEIATLHRIDLFCPVLSNEYRMLRRVQPWFRARYLRWNYGNAEDDLSLEGSGAAAPGAHLLLGNSATPANNHLELFERIRRHGDLGDRQLVVPLSYGDAAYRQHIVAAGERMFGRAFVPLLDFVDKDRYLQILDSCGFALMNHIRQQALGNLCMAALRGARLFLNRHNPAYDWLHLEGIPAEDLERLELQPLPAAERQRQVEAMRRSIGRGVQRERTRQLVQALQAPVAHSCAEAVAA